jgi:hypothetical protein
MKTKISLIICSIILFVSGCYDREIIDFKSGNPIDPVTNLDYAIDGANVTLSWDLPAQYPDDIVLPVSVLIRVHVDDVLKSSPKLTDSPTTYTYTTYDPLKSYVFVVKVVGSVETDDPNMSTTRYSPGEYVIID